MSGRRPARWRARAPHDPRTKSLRDGLRGTPRALRSRPISALVGLAVACALSPAPAAAQVPAGKLAERLTQVEAELAREREGLAEERARRASVAENTAARRRDLAREVVELELERLRRTSARESGRGELVALRLAATRERQQRDELRKAVTRLRDALAIALEETPGTAAERRALDALAAASSTSEEVGDDAPGASPTERPAPAWERVLSLFDRIHARGCAVTRRATSLVTASGHRESVELISAGGIAHLYRTSDGRVGAALASPRDARGYRWAEGTGWTGERLEALPEGWLPLDPSGRLRRDDAPARTLVERLRSGGPVMIPLALVALIALLLALERVIALLRAGRGGERAARAVLRAIEDGDLVAATALARRRGGTVARVLSAALDDRGGTGRSREDAVAEALMSESPRLERFLGGLQLLGAVAPLLGLLGTVTGIIRTFAAIQRLGNGDPTLLAGGISEALVTTATGLAVAIPVLLVHGALAGRADRILADAESAAARLLNALSAPGGPATRPEAPADREVRP